MRRSLLLALLGAAGAAADDASALVQAQVQRHGRHEAVRLEGLERAFGGAAEGLSRQLAEALSELPSPSRQAPEPLEPTGGVTVRRVGGEAEAGGGVEFSLGGCGTEESAGPSGCGLRFGEEARVTYRVRLRSGLRKGDRVSITLAARYQALNASEPLSSTLTGQALGSGVSCDICEGTCTLSLAAADGKFLLDSTTPSLVHNETWCAGLEEEPLRSFDLADLRLSIPAPPASWQLAGEVVSSLEVRGRDGALRVSETTRLSVVPGAAAAPAGPAPPAPPSSLAGSLRQSLRAAPAMLLEARRAGAAEGQRRLAPGGRQAAAKRLGQLVLKLKVSDLERASAQNVTLHADGCTAALDGQGSTECRLDFAAAANVTLGLHIEFSTEEGSYSVVKTTPKVGGMLGLMAGAFLKPTTLRAPLCGTGTSKLEGQPPSEVDAGPCGFHAVNLVVPPLTLLLPDLGSVPLRREGVPAPPMLPATLGQLPPISVQVDARMYHADGTAIGHFQLDLGLAYAA